MSIQLDIQKINERSRTMEFGLLFVAAAVAVCFIFTADFWFAIAVVVVYIPSSIGLQHQLRTWRSTRILELYRYQCEPIFEIQSGPGDKYNFQRAEYHREMLIESGNEIYARTLITVEEIYDRDPRFGYAETPEEQEIRRNDYIREFLNSWALALTKDNAKFVKQWLNQQEIGEPIIEKADPSVSETKTGDFWSFPLLTAIFGGKEVKSA